MAPDSSVGKKSACNEGDLGLIPGLGRSLEEGKGYPLQYSGLKNSYSAWGGKVSDTTEKLSLFTLKEDTSRGGGDTNEIDRDHTSIHSINRGL